MTEAARTLIFFGIIFIITGAVLLLVGKIPGVGKLPGDIMIKKENLSFYFPITTCIIISVIFSLIMYFWNHR